MVAVVDYDEVAVVYTAVIAVSDSKFDPVWCFQGLYNHATVTEDGSDEDEDSQRLSTAASMPNTPNTPNPNSINNNNSPGKEGAEDADRSAPTPLDAGAIIDVVDSP